ncbi:MAG: hypothetical protein ACPF8V_06490, partial [Luteibaculum sp.]
MRVDLAVLAWNSKSCLGTNYQQVSQSYQQGKMVLQHIDGRWQGKLYPSLEKELQEVIKQH